MMFRKRGELPCLGEANWPWLWECKNISSVTSWRCHKVNGRLHKLIYASLDDNSKSVVFFFSFYYHEGNMQREDEGGGGRKVELRCLKDEGICNQWQTCHWVCGRIVPFWNGTGKKWRYSTATETALEIHAWKWLKFNEYNKKKNLGGLVAIYLID